MGRSVKDTSFIRATDQDVRKAIRSALKHAGVSSVDELRAQAERGWFDSDRARAAWTVLSTLTGRRASDAA